MRGIIDGTNEEKSFVHKSRAIYRTFAIAIRETAPNFQPFENISTHELQDDGKQLFDGEIPDDSLTPGRPVDLYEVRRIIKEYEPGSYSCFMVLTRAFTADRRVGSFPEMSLILPRHACTDGSLMPGTNPLMPV